MRILWLSHLIPFPPKGGVLQRSYYLLKELARYNEVDLLAFNQPELISPLFESVEKGINEANNVLSRICRRVEFFEINSEQSDWGRYALALKSLVYEPYNINWLKSSRFQSRIKELMSRNAYDLVHFDTISLIPFFCLIPCKISSSLDHHNIESHMLLRRAWKEKNPIKRLYFWQEGLRLQNYERRFCPKFSVNITCSDIDRARLLNIAPLSNVRTIPNGVDIDYFKPKGLRTTGHRLIFVGSMNWYPNIEAVLYIGERLWPWLKLKHPDLTCEIIGANPPKSIRILAEKHQDFHVRGFVEDIRPFMEAATVYVCPIHDGGGTKLKILDAMAMGKAIVAHPVACEGIDLEHGKNVMIAENDTMFIEHIDYLLSADAKRESLGKEARRLVKESYDFCAIGQQLSIILQECVR
jgi:polysaccharide biosynthesis protein PslH